MIDIKDNKKLLIGIIIVIVVVIIAIIIYMRFGEKKEVYLYAANSAGANWYMLTPQDIPTYETKYNAKLATLDQLNDAYKDGFQQCVAGFCDDGKTRDATAGAPLYIIMQTADSNCAGKGVSQFSSLAPKGAIFLYGVKPSSTVVPKGDTMFSFYGNQWSYYDKKI